MKLLICLFIFLVSGASSSGCEGKPPVDDPEDQEPVKPAYIEPDATGMRLELNAIDFSRPLKQSILTTASIPEVKLPGVTRPLRSN
jgi:hypothetical protein